MNRWIEQHPALALASGATLVSGAPILVKAIGQAGMGPTGIALWRCVLGTLFLLLAARLARTKLRLRRPVLLLAVLAGIAFAVDLFVWHRSILLAGAGLATILGNTQVFVTAILSALLLGERLSLRFGLAALTAVVGIVLLVGIGSGLAFPPGYGVGVAYGLLTGLIYGIFLVLLRQAGRKLSDPTGFALPVWFTLIAALSLVGLAALEQTPTLPPDRRSWIGIVLLAALAQGVGWWTIARSLPRVRGAIGGLLLLIQPVLAIFWGMLIFGERLAALQWIGAVLTLGAVYAGARKS